jgi:cell division protein FtsI/penicillin-binding protein 2
MSVPSKNIQILFTKQREKFFVVSVLIALATILTRLFYWQVIQAKTLQAAAENQYQRSFTSSGSRGEIFTSDNYPLVTNEPIYRLFAQPHLLKVNPNLVSESLAQIISEQEMASVSAQQSTKLDIIEKLTKPNAKWVSLHSAINKDSKEKIEALKIFGLGFDLYERRAYPEASMAAHITGFVGKDDLGLDIGYFGIEGALEKELQSRSNTTTVITDALGIQLLGSGLTQNTPNGRAVVTTIRRDVQFVIEEYLRDGIEKYGAKSGEIIVMDPTTGKILGLAAFPTYNQESFYEFPPEQYKNPSIADLYEPGSTFKILTVASGIDSGVITPETTCTKCSGPRVFGKYTIKTWNDVYNPGITIEEGLAKSDNTAMIFVAELLGSSKFSEYLQKFQIGRQLNIDLQEDVNTPFTEKLGQVELATTSFGQGVVVNSLQLLRAVSAIANQGEIMRPMIVEKVIDPLSGEELLTPIVSESQVISPQTAQTVTKMMITAAQAGEAQWTASKTHTIAGKTGTSQVAAGGSYDENKTIASYIGFVPPDKPKFIMLVKLVEPTSSPWAAETAAPLWYDVANKLFLLFNIPPDRS